VAPKGVLSRAAVRERVDEWPWTATSWILKISRAKPGDFGANRQEAISFLAQYVTRRRPFHSSRASYLR
jgi:hypothetical protein